MVSTAQLPPRDRVLLRWARTRPAAAQGQLPEIPHHRRKPGSAGMGSWHGLRLLLVRQPLSAPVSWQQCDLQWKINLFILFSSLYCSTKVSMLLNCVASALHCSISSLLLKSLMEQRQQSLPSSHVHFFQPVWWLFVCLWCRQKTETGWSCCRNGFAGRLHRDLPGI